MPGVGDGLTTPRASHCEVDGKAVQRVVVVVKRQSNLFQVVLALRPTSSLTRLLNGGKKQGNQDRNNCDHDQQFDQCESDPLLLFHVSLGEQREK